MVASLFRDSITDEQQAVNDGQFYRVFEKYCPYFMSMGVTYEQYWYGDPEITRMTLKAHKLKHKMRNSELWLMGRYVYEVMGDVYPLFNSMADDHKPADYLKYPFPLTDEEVREQEIQKQKDKMLEIKAYMESKSGGMNNG